MNESRPVLPIYLLLMMALAGGSTLLFEEPFRSTRPKETVEFTSGTSDTSDVPARLWQDPITAALEEFRRREAAADDPCVPTIVQISGIDGAAPEPNTLHAAQVRETPAFHDAGCSSGILSKYLSGIIESGAGTSPADGETGTARLMMLFALVRGGHYQGDVEARRRSRYAVLSGLMTSGFLPVEDRFIGYFLAPENKSGSPRQESRIVAFEILRRNASEFVIVVWLPEQLVRAWPPTFLDQAHCGSTKRSGTSMCRLREQTEVVVLGPASSDSLIDLLACAAGSVSVSPSCAIGVPRFEDEAANRKSLHKGPRPHRRAPPIAKLYSPFATVTAERLIDRVMRQYPETQGVIRFLRASQFSGAQGGADDDAVITKLLTGFEIGSLSVHGLFSKFTRGRADDGAVADALQAELQQRSIDVFDCDSDTPRNSIALVGEADRAFTKYWIGEIMDRARCDAGAPTADIGLTDPLELIEPVCRWASPDSQSFRDSQRSQSFGACVTPFYYLQGLDGSLAEDQEPPASASKNTESAVKIVDPETLARPVGDSQFDYLRRLADEVRRQSQVLQEKGGHGIRAIGIFGSDVYDKLLILQAMKQELPAAIYFTNDLDARLFHPANYEWTRNLIVGSSYGLSIRDTRTRGTRNSDPQLRSTVPPFRDASQTSTFLAVGMAIQESDLFRETNLASQQLADMFGFTYEHTGNAAQSDDRSSRSNLQLAWRSPIRTDSTNAWAPPKPRVFEIGRSGPVDVTFREFDVAPPESLEDVLHGDFGPDLDTVRRQLPYLGSAMLFLILVLVLTGRTDVWFRELKQSFRLTRSEFSTIPGLSSKIPNLDVNTIVALLKRGPQGPTVVAEGTAKIDPAVDQRRSIFASAFLVYVNFALLVEFLIVLGYPFQSILLAKLPIWTLSWYPTILPENLESSTPFDLARFAALPSVAILALWILIGSTLWLLRTTIWPRVGIVSPWVMVMLLSVNIVVAFVAFFLKSATSGYFEPPVWVDGVSSWPTEIIRLIAAIVGFTWLFAKGNELQNQFRHMVRDYFGIEVDGASKRLTKWFPLDWGLQTQIDNLPCDQPLSGCVREYAEFSRISRRVVRTLLLALLHTAAVVILFEVSEPPATPIRGLWAQALDVLMLLTVVPLVIFTAMYVTDATRICARLVRFIASKSIDPDFCHTAVSKTRAALGLGSKYYRPAEYECVREYLRLDFVARLTEPVSRLLLLPFVIIALLVISRSTVFDHWHWNMPVVVAISAVAIYSLFSALRLRRAAELARLSVEERLGAILRSAYDNERKESLHEFRPEQIQSVIGLVQDETRGAFNRWFRNPIVQALLLPFGGAGAVALFDVLLTVR